MKTNFYFSLALSTRYILPLILFLFGNATLDAQSRRVNTVTGVDLYSSGNAHGAFLFPYMQFSKKRHSISFGPLLQNCSMQMKGARMAYTRNLSAETAAFGSGGYKDLFQMNFFTYAQYTDALPLAHSVIADERLIVRTQEINFDNLRFSTAETGAGFELQINFTNHFSWKNYVAAAVYYHFNYIKGLDHEQVAPVLTLGTGVALDF